LLLQTHVVSILSNIAGSEGYLKNLADCHSKFV
jgi:hypothetical protein